MTTTQEVAQRFVNSGSWGFLPALKQGSVETFAEWKQSSAHATYSSKTRTVTPAAAKGEH